MQKYLIKEIIFEAFLCIYVVVVVFLCWQMPLVASLLLALGLYIQYLFNKKKSDIVIMVAAAVLGTPAEIICVKYGVWSYHAPGLVFGIPIWIPFIWAFLLSLFQKIANTKILVFNEILPSHKKLIQSIILYGLGTLILVYSVTTIILINKEIAIVYAVVFVITIYFSHKQIDIMIFLVGGILGTLGEYMCMKLGFWHYNFPYLKAIGLPLSLPLAWGLSSVIVTRISKVVK